MSKRQRVQVYFSNQDIEYLKQVKAETGEQTSQTIKRILHLYQMEESRAKNHIVIPGEYCEHCSSRYNAACIKCDKVIHKFEYVKR